MAVSQPATFNEAWSQERIYNYLNHLPPSGECKDFFILYNAYKHMRVQDFTKLLQKFVTDGHDVHAKNSNGENFAQVISRHPHQSAPFLTLLEQY